MDEEGATVAAACLTGTGVLVNTDNIPAALFKVWPFEYFIYTFLLYNQAHCLEKLLYLELSRSPNGYFKQLLLRSRFGDEAVFYDL
jgi:hypothetical protein